ncbi:MAG TPA: hypothetical protein PLJ00_13060 [Chitinophagales bacterium]|nr:hypothetical protein [Chitinophagales bacterium]
MRKIYLVTIIWIFLFSIGCNHKDCNELIQNKWVCRSVSIEDEDLDAFKKSYNYEYDKNPNFDINLARTNLISHFNDAYIGGSIQFSNGKITTVWHPGLTAGDLDDLPLWEYSYQISNNCNEIYIICDNEKSAQSLLDTIVILELNNDQAKCKVNNWLTITLQPVRDDTGDLCGKEIYAGKWQRGGFANGGIMTIEDNGNNLIITDERGERFTATIQNDCSLKTDMGLIFYYRPPYGNKEKGWLNSLNGDYRKIN